MATATAALCGFTDIKFGNTIFGQDLAWLLRGIDGIDELVRPFLNDAQKEFHVVDGAQPLLHHSQHWRIIASNEAAR